MASTAAGPLMRRTRRSPSKRPTTVATGAPASASPTSGRAALSGSLASGAERSKHEARVAGGTAVAFDLNLSLRNAAAATALVKAISTPGSAEYRHFLTQSQWIARFAPTQASVSSAATWLKQQGFAVGAIPADRLFIPASGSAAQVERAFGTTLSTYKVSGKGVLWSYIINHRPRPDMGTEPHAIAVVKLEEGPTMMTNIVDCPQTPEALQLDMPVQVSFARQTDHITLPLFAPVKR